MTVYLHIYPFLFVCCLSFSFFQANDENVETNFLYAEVLVRVTRAAKKGAAGAAGGKKCTVM